MGYVCITEACGVRDGRSGKVEHLTEDCGGQGGKEEELSGRRNVYSLEEQERASKTK